MFNGTTAGDLQPLVFGQMLNFSGRSQQPKMKTIYIYLYLLNEKKTEFIASREMKHAEIQVFTYWVGE